MNKYIHMRRIVIILCLSVCCTMLQAQEKEFGSQYIQMLADTTLVM